MRKIYKNTTFKLQFFVLFFASIYSKNINAQVCTAAFTPSGCISGNMQFWNTSTGTSTNTTHYWNFGDGGISFILNPSHTYTLNGIYNVCLQIKDSLTGCNSVKCQTINVNCVASSSCTAAFTPSACISGSMYFFNFSSGITASTNYSWTFGDGGTSVIKNPLHTYTANGIYNVCLTISDSVTGCLSTKCQTVNIICLASSSCVAAFTPSGCVSGNMQFWNTSTGTTTNTSYYWTFGDGGNAFIMNPSHTYTSNGIYNVCLNIYDSLAGCNSTKCQTVNINCVSTSTSSCMAAFTPSGCVSGNMQFWNTSTGTTTNTTHYWTFGDGGNAFIMNPSHTYTSNGIYNVCLTIYDSLASCYSTKCQTVNINCVSTGSCLSAFTSYSCWAGTTWFVSSSTGTTSTTTYQWFFGDGGNSILPNPSHTYTANGIYNVCLSIYDSLTSCLSTTCKTVNINCVSTSIKQYQSEGGQINILPNPNDGSFTLDVSLTANSTKAQILIYNLIGDVIYKSEEELRSGRLQKTISINEVASGSYIIRISTDTGQQTKKLIITR